MNHLCGIHLRKIPSQEKTNTKQKIKTVLKFSKCFEDLVFGSSSKKWWRRQWHPTLVLLPGKSHGWRSLVGCSPWGREESDTTEWLHFHFSLSSFGEGNGNLLQCSCLENPRDGGAWWAAVYGVAQSWTWLKQLSSSSSSKKRKRNKSKLNISKLSYQWWKTHVGKNCESI